MNNHITLKARAKINIALNVIGKRADGYHNLKMIMQTTNLYDTLSIKKSEDGKITLKTNSNKIPSDENNLVYKAAAYLKNAYSIKDGILIELVKNIPAAAGLAGGSADCAAALTGIKALFNLPISDKDLKKAALSLGADVPYCLIGGTVLAEGIGEKLTPLKPFPQMYVLLAKPNIDISTAAVFKAFDPSKVKNFPDVEKIIYGIEHGDIKYICENMHNVLESVTIPLCPIIKDIKQEMLDNGALAALMSGSGPTSFGLFSSKEDCLCASNKIKNKFGIQECYSTVIFNSISHNSYRKATMAKQ